MKDNLLKYILIVSLLLNISLLTTAGYVYFKQEKNRSLPLAPEVWNGSYLFEKLSLKPEQAQRLKEEAVSFHAEIDKKRQEVINKRIALVSLLRSDHSDSEAIDATIFQISKMQGEIQRMAALHILDVKATLDRDQQKRFLDLIEEVMSKRAGRCP